jgi:type I restriction enzyme S subunit
MYPIDAHIDAYYLQQYMLSDTFLDQAVKNDTRVAMPKINQTELNAIVVPVPPLSEQHRIVAKVNQLMTLVDQLETRISETQSVRAALLDTMIQEVLSSNASRATLANTSRDTNERRAAIGCYVVGKMADKPYFGRTAAMKVLYLAEAHIGLELRGKYEREAAGPFDQWIYEFQREGVSRGWFEVVESNIGRGRTKAEYRIGSALKAKASLARLIFTDGQRKEFDRLLKLFADMKTEDVEIVATLFAAWNDFLIDGRTPIDDEIIREVRENWHASKRRFSPSKLASWLDWMRSKRLVPQGRLPRTLHQTRLELN